MVVKAATGGVPRWQESVGGASVGGAGTFRFQTQSASCVGKAGDPGGVNEPPVVTKALNTLLHGPPECPVRHVLLIALQEPGHLVPPLWLGAPVWPHCMMQGLDHLSTLSIVLMVLFCTTSRHSCWGWDSAMRTGAL